MSSGSRRMAPTFLRGLSEANGFWNTNWTRRRNRCASPRGGSSASTPSSISVPSVGGSTRPTRRPSVDLPDPELADDRERAALGDVERHAAHRGAGVRVRETVPCAAGRCGDRFAAETSGRVMAGAVRRPRSAPCARDRRAGSGSGLGRLARGAGRDAARSTGASRSGSAGRTGNRAGGRRRPARRQGSSRGGRSAVLRSGSEASRAAV